MPHKRKPKQASPPPQALSSLRRFSFDWFSDTEAFLAEALARADASSAVAGGGTPPQLPSPLLKSLPLPSAVLGPEFRRLDRAFLTVDLKFLNFESDDNALEEEGVSPPPPAPSASGDPGAVPPDPVASEAPAGPSLHPQDAHLWCHVLSDAETEKVVDAIDGPLYPPPPPPPPAPSASGDPGAMPPNPVASEAPAGPSLHPQDTHLWRHVLSDAETEKVVDAIDGPLYPPPPPAPYMDGAPGASLWNPDIDVVSVDTVHPQDMPLVADVLSLSCVLAQQTQDISRRYAENTHDTFIAKPSRLSEDNTLPVPPPSPGTEARDIFLAHPPHVVVREVCAVFFFFFLSHQFITWGSLAVCGWHIQTLSTLRLHYAVPVMYYQNLGTSFWRANAGRSP
jgi:hypothetical protein